MRRVLLIFITTIYLLPLSLKLNAQTLTGPPYSENFNTLVNTGTSDITPPGWFFIESGSNANFTCTANNGSSNTGDTYSYGSVSSTDRAFGGLQSGSLVTILSVLLYNQTGSTITSVSISYKGEQWRLGATGRVDRLDFQYGTNESGPWTDADALDFIAPVSSGIVGALDGNLVSNQTAISHTIAGLSVTQNDTLILRWIDFNASGADDGLAIDDFTISYTTSADVTSPSLVSLSPANGATNHQYNSPLLMNFNEPIQKGTGDIRIVNVTDPDTSYVNVNSSIITVAAATVTIDTILLINKQYSVSMPSGVFKDMANNNYAGLAAGNWVFSTVGITSYNYNFNTCTPFDTVSTGWKQFSVTGDSIWKCTSFGYNSSNGVQMSGFVNPTGPAVNEDWLISPSLNLTAFNVPVLSFYARTKFVGNRIDVLVSTNYGGTGNPNSATWTVLSTALPLENSDIWTLVDSINLSNYKTASTYIAFKYTSATTAASRWTLDNFDIRNAAGVPGPLVQVTNPVINFDNITSGNSSAARSFQFVGVNFGSTLNIIAPATFGLSKDNVVFSGNISYTVSEVANGYKTVYVRYSPTANNSVNNGFLNFNGTNGYNNNKIEVAGNSYSFAATLDIVNWNLEWFGSTTNGPADDNLQQANVKKVMDSLQADIYALCEIVDTTRLMNLVNSLGGYAYKVSDYCSNAPDPSDPDYATGQKLAFIYKTSVVTNVKVRGMLKTSAAANSNWASGRVPYLMEADVVNGAATKKYNFLVIHGKAGNTNSDYQRRKDGAKELKDTLDAQFSTANVMIIGDYNDDLDSTISAGITPPRLTSYDDIVKDSTDADRYKSLTMPLSLAGLRSTISNPEVIDHVVVSNELTADVILRSAKLVRDVETWIANYESTTTDHYPVMSRTLMPATVTGVTNTPPDTIQLRLMPNPVKTELIFSFKPAAGNVQIDIMDVNGRLVKRIPSYRSASVNQIRTINLEALTTGVYFLKIGNNQKLVARKFVKL